MLLRLIPHSLSCQQFPVDENKLLLFSSRQTFFWYTFNSTSPEKWHSAEYFRAVRTRQLALRQHHRRANKSSRKEKVLRVSQRRAASVSGRRTCKNEIKMISFPVPFWARVPALHNFGRLSAKNFSFAKLACGRFSSGVQRNLLTFHPSRATHKTR